MQPVGDMSRKELEETVTQLREALLIEASKPPLAPCPFCEGLRFVPFLKHAIRGHLVEQWKPNVTEAEYDVYVAEMQERFKSKGDSK